MPIPKSYTKEKKELAKSGKIFPAKRPDPSNLVKLPEDALNGICWNDDSQIVALTAHKYYSEEPRTEVTILKLKEFKGSPPSEPAYEDEEGELIG